MNKFKLCLCFCLQDTKLCWKLTLKWFREQANFTKSLRYKQVLKSHAIIIFKVKIEIRKNFYYEI